MTFFFLLLVFVTGTSIWATERVDRPRRRLARQAQPPIQP